MNKLKKFNSYSEYFDTGVEFIGQIPKHWNVKKLKHTVEGCFNGIWGDPPTGNNNDIACIRVADFNRNNRTVNIYDLTYRNIQKKYQNNRLLRSGDLLLEKSGGGENQPVGCVVLFNQNFEAISSNFIARMPIRNDYEPRFLNYLHWFLYDSKINTKSIKQTTGIQNIDQDAYLSEEVGIPPLSEQQAIANFLNYQTSKIDALIEKQERLIVLLEEKRNALIAHAVTKGLDPDVPMKDSGVEWLGEIPEHWELLKAKYLFKELSRPIGEEDEVITAFRDGEVTLRTNRRTDGFTFSIKEIGYQGVRKGDLVIHQMDGFAGAIGVSDSDGKCSPVYSVCQPKMELNNYLYAQMLRHMAHSGYITSLAKGIRQRSTDFRFNTFGEELLPIFSIDEQNRIYNYIKTKTLDIDFLVKKIKRLIQVFQEYRSSLISSAVTGKIDVRDWQEKEFADLE
jgi:type I restriction enzyme S subunit